MKRDPEDILAEAIWRAKELFGSQILVEVDGNRLQFMIQWDGPVEASQQLLDEFDRWWLFYAADVCASFHVEFIAKLTPADSTHSDESGRKSNNVLSQEEK